jgi:protoporphyrinogen oxidase
VLPHSLILGAGPAGMAAAMELHAADHDFLLVDQADAVGGLARTYTVEEDGLVFRTDHGPHRFFSKNPYLYDFIGDLLLEDWRTVRRQTRQYIDGTFFDYPLNPAQILATLGPARVGHALLDWTVARGRRLLGRPIRSFEDFAVDAFGRSLADLNILPYTEKVWGVPCDQLDADWARQRIAGLDMASLLRDAARKLLPASESAPRSLVDTFLYPLLGTGTIYEAIASRMREAGHRILLRTRPTAVRHDGVAVRSVRIEGPDGAQELAPDQVITSVHLPDLIRLLDPPPPAEVLGAAARLRYRSQTHLFVTLDRPSVTADQWIYFPDRRVPFARASEMRNFSAAMSPPGKTSWFIELFCEEGDWVHRLDAAGLASLVLPHVEAMGFFHRSEVRACYRFPGGRDYPLYAIGYREHLDVVLGWLRRLRNLIPVGRPGRFKYTNQDHSLEMGILAARQVVDGTPRDLAAVGSEQAWFEQGHLPPLRRGR